MVDSACEDYCDGVNRIRGKDGIRGHQRCIGRMLCSKSQAGKPRVADVHERPVVLAASVRQTAGERRGRYEDDEGERAARTPHVASVTRRCPPA